jgi:Fe-S oxidoreductase
VPLARRFVRVFNDYEAIVCQSGSCVAMVAEQYPRLAELAGEHAGEVCDEHAVQTAWGDGCGDDTSMDRAHPAG